MQKFLFLFLLFLCAASTNTTAQIKKTSEPQETFKVLKINNPELKKYFLDNSLYPTWGIGFYRADQMHALRDLKDIVKVSPMAMAEYRAYKDLNTAKNVLTVASIACLVGALASFAKSTSNFRPAAFLYSGSVLCSIVSFPVSLSAKEHLNQTFRNYNADLIGNFKNE
ncbi:MAG: hypothetical protein RLZZ292_831 [Bacteroidota bacterium]|jgi:hypothetical protein